MTEGATMIHYDTLLGLFVTFYVIGAIGWTGVLWTALAPLVRDDLPRLRLQVMSAALGLLWPSTVVLMMVVSTEKGYRWVVRAIGGEATR